MDEEENMNFPKKTGIFLGDRGPAFKDLIIKVLRYGQITEKYLQFLTTPEHILLYGDAFTSEHVDSKNNYQIYEQLGDLSVNKFIVEYIYTRFPQLRCCEGVKIVARLRINYGSKESFHAIADELGFFDFITATNDARYRQKKSLLEDVFEAFIGMTEMLLNEVFHGVGWGFCYTMLKGIFDKKKISLEYEDLYDAKTRLKELIDQFHQSLGPIVYEDKKTDLIATSYIYRLKGAQFTTNADGKVNMNNYTGRYTKVLIGQGSAALKANAQQNAASEALKNLAKEGFVKYPPRIYARMSKANYEEKETTKQDVLKICETEGKINEQFFTKGKSKYQPKYTSTALIFYCRQRDLKGIKECVAMGANPNVKDSEGLSALDILLIGRTDKDLVNQVLKEFSRFPKLDMSEIVYQIYSLPYALDKSRLNLV